MPEKKKSRLVSEQNMVEVLPSSIELGPIPFSLYSSDDSGRLVLFCKTGYQITKQHRDTLSTGDRSYFVTSEDLGAFYDYAFERVDRIVASDKIPMHEKAQMLNGMGKRIVTLMLDDPGNSISIKRCGKLLNSFLEIIIYYSEVTDDLLSFAPTDNYYLTHSISVSVFSILIGRKLFGDKRRDLWLLGMAGLLHDVGMTRVPPEIVNKPGRLDPTEMTEIRQHPIYSLEMTVRHSLPHPVKAAIRGHHERLDGSGYPDGLQSTRIHVFARIVAVADVYDAMTSDRPYRQKIHQVQALAEIARQKAQFDQGVVKSLLEIVLRNKSLVDGFRKKLGLE